VPDLLRNAPTGYAPASDMADLVWCNGPEETQPLVTGCLERTKDPLATKTTKSHEKIKASKQ